TDKVLFLLRLTIQTDSARTIAGKKSTLSVESVLRSVSEDPRLEVYPLDLAVIARTVGLTAIKEMHDRQIVATALVLQSQGEKVSLLTCDRNITDSNLVPTIW
ncbi:MAG: hypothetical protein AAFP03_18220, partial [Cyanobacteria bacterium J06598_3]